MKEKINGAFEAVRTLERLVAAQEVAEPDLITLAEAEGIQLGGNPKPRLNYLVSLNILRKPKPVQFGKGKGGTRFFQNDVLEVLRFVDETQDFALNEIRDIISERRNDLVKQACKELDVDATPTPDLIKKGARSEAMLKCLFGYDYIKACVLSLKIVRSYERLESLDAEIGALTKMQNTIDPTVCSDCAAKIEGYIGAQKAEAEALKSILAHDIDLALAGI